ncbi:MAG TPA: hypothetical protein VFE82_19490 [Ramlibacter sp.]|uniref:hypothetical protein n=1 Tax=Ramlibacter sp. TaxID=1917967 RepID=UPI002D4CACCD|nr:hypothetical protein [Ramlibacter sp.]HZY20664.1 hypothetical protein [Ramlibacter sp.]
MQSIVQHLPEILRAAAASQLGILALMVVAIAAIAHAFFRKSAEGWRMAALALLFAGCAGFGYAMFQQSATRAAAQVVNVRESLDRWLDEAGRARDAGTLSGASSLPSGLVDARNEFESRWRRAALPEKLALPADAVASGLSLLNRLYREVEKDSPVQQAANLWADEAIRHFDERQDPRRLTDALLDKAAIYLDLAQLGHDDRQQFEAMARSGDALMARAFRTAAIDQQPQVLRITSRFYYNLARPKSFRLSDTWDNTYLLLAYQKARAAHDLQPGELKNANQLARTVIKVSRNPPQDTDPAWAENLRDAQDGMAAAWSAAKAGLTGVEQRLSPLNVLGVVTLEAIAREWTAASPQERRARAGRYLIELERDALPALREAAALLQNSALRKAYGFDIHYDLARAQALKTALVRVTSAQAARAEFKEVRSHLAVARENARTSQLEAALRDLGKDPSFSLLTPAERQGLAQLLNLG